MSSSNAFDSAERDALIALSLVEGVGFVGIRRMRVECGGFAAALEERYPASEVRALRQQGSDLQEQAAAVSCSLITYEDPDYPACLFDLNDAPMLLYAKGNRKILDQPAVAIVGTRNCTRYGERIAKELSAALASAGACVVSGLAKGIDSAAHRGALEVSGATCAVIGTGIDLVYPVGHASLQRIIEEQGYLVTESKPGMTPFMGSFPRRNRIIAALAPLTIVVEAPFRSGAKSTSDHALALNRTLAAVPGPIDSIQSSLCNTLIRDGAHIIASIDDALALAGVLRSRRSSDVRDFTPPEDALLSVLAERNLTTQQLVEMSGLPISECLAAISSLEIDGIIEAGITGEFRRCVITRHRKKAAPVS